MSFFSDLFNPPASKIPAPATYTAGNMGGADANMFGGIGNLGNFNLYPGLLPGYNDIVQRMMLDPNAQQGLTGSQDASRMGQNAAWNQFGAGNQLYGMGNALLPAVAGLFGASPELFSAGRGLFGAAQPLFGAAGDILRSGFDPQSGLYDRMLQQTQDQARAAQGARGIATTPFGAGLENDAVRKFNLDWQNNMLSRQLAAGQGAGGLVGQGTNTILGGGGMFGQGAGLLGSGANIFGNAGNMFTQGAGLQGGAPGMLQSANMLPWLTGQQIGGSQLGLLSNLGQFGAQGAAIPQQQIADYLGYLGWGTGQQNANTSQFKALLDQSKLATDQQKSMFSGIGSLLGGLTGLGGFGSLAGLGGMNIGGLFGGSPYSMQYGSNPFNGAGGINPAYSTGGAPMMFSDVNVKDDVEQVGELYDGLPVYSFRYKGDPTPRLGLMAQDVERVRPDAVRTIAGVKAVDYGKATEWSRGIAALSNW